MRGSYSKFRVIALALCCALLFSLCGCKKDAPTEKTPDTSSFVVSTRSEKINDIEWTISYYEETGETISISALQSENEKISKYYNWLSFYHGDNSTYVTHTIELIGKPLDEGWFQITQTEIYKSGWSGYDAKDLAKWQQNYVPDCSLDETDHLVFYKRITRYDEKIPFKPYFPVPAAPIVTENTRLKFVLSSTGEVVITDENLKNVEIVTDDASGYGLMLYLDEVGTKRFAAFSSKYIGETISIFVIVDGVDSIVSSPTIMSAITNGEIVISVSGTRQDAEYLYRQITGNDPN